MSSAVADAWATLFTRAHQENFAVLSLLLPRPLRPAFACIYAFCRVADDAADEHRGSAADREAACRRLDELESLVADAAGSKPTPDPELPWLGYAVANAIARDHRSSDGFRQLLQAFRMDQQTVRYQTLQDVRAYCRLSAEPVGRMVLRLGFTHEPADLYPASDSICTALQLINHWQDVRRDLLERDRIYLPEEELRRHGFGHAELTEALRSGQEADLLPAYRAALEPLVEDAAVRLEAGRQLPRSLPRSLRRPVRLFIAGGEAVVTQVRRQGYDTLTRRAALRRRARAGALLKGLMP